MLDSSSARGPLRTVRGLLAVLAAVALTGAAGCNREPVRIEGTFDSLERLANAVLDGLARTDRTSLQRLAITQAEFRGRVYPELPASRPERNLSSDYLWKDLHQKSEAQLTDTLRSHGGRRYSLVAVTFLGSTTRHATFAVARKAQLRVRDESGAEQDVRLFGSVLTNNGRHKVFSFVVD